MLCDAEIGKPGAWRSCQRAATVTVVTRIGGVLHYCKRHETRATDATGRYHSGARSVAPCLGT